MEPECIVFDEPTAMLDPRGRKEIMEIMESLRKEGITIVLITHFMDEAVLTDRILVMDRGRIIKEGKPAEVFTDKNITEMFKADLPCAAELAIRLRERGMDVPGDIITEDALLDYLEGIMQDQEQSV